MKLSFLGCGDAFQYELGNNAATFRKGDDLFFVDMGQSIFQKAIHLNLLEGVSSVTIFITHMHLDHIGSISEAIVYLTAFNKKEVTIVYPGADELAKRLNGIVPMDGIRLIKGLSGCVHGVSYKAVDAKHGACPYSYFLRDESDFIYYSGDDSVLNGEALELLKQGKLDALYQDASEKSSAFHLGLAELDEMVPKEFKGKVHVMHSPSLSFVERAKSLGFSAAFDERL